MVQVDRPGVAVRMTEVEGQQSCKIMLSETSLTKFGIC